MFSRSAVSEILKVKLFGLPFLDVAKTKYHGSPTAEFSASSFSEMELLTALFHLHSSLLKQFTTDRDTEMPGTFPKYSGH